MNHAPMAKPLAMQPIFVDTTHVISTEPLGHGSLRHPLLVALVSLELLLLAIQFVLGMFVNLFVTLPSPVFGMYGMMQLMVNPGMPAVMGHLVGGMVLGGLAILTFAGSTVTRNRLLIATTGGTLASVVGAGISGMEFLFSGQNNAFSYGMSVGFLLAFTLAFLSLLVASGRAR